MSEPPDKPQPEQTCFAPEGLENPSSIAEMVDLINALPRPLTVPCLLQTLPRPLTIDATKGTFSLQPAYGKNNPRYLLTTGGLTVSVVPKGPGRPLVELAEARTELRSVKAEIECPLTEELPMAAPFERIVEGSGTKCAFCHFSEIPDLPYEDLPAFVSDVIFVLPEERVELEYLQWTYDVCDAEQEPDRCAMLESIFGFGEVLGFEGP